MKTPTKPPKPATKMLTLRCTADLIKSLDAVAASRKMTRTDLIIEALQADLKVSQKKAAKAK